MKLYYTVYDDKAELARGLYVAETEADALRAVHASMSGDSLLRRYPDDYRVIIVAEFNEKGCALLPFEPPKALMTCRQLASILDPKESSNAQQA